MQLQHVRLKGQLHETGEWIMYAHTETKTWVSQGCGALWYFITSDRCNERWNKMPRRGQQSTGHTGEHGNVLFCFAVKCTLFSHPQCPNRKFQSEIIAENVKAYSTTTAHAPDVRFTHRHSAGHRNCSSRSSVACVRIPFKFQVTFSSWQ